MTPPDAPAEKAHLIMRRPGICVHASLHMVMDNRRPVNDGRAGRNAAGSGGSRAIGAG